MLARSLLGVSNEDLAIEIADPERSKIVWYARIDKTMGVHSVKIFIINIHPTIVEIGRVQKIMTVDDPKGEAFVNRMPIAMHCFDRVRLIEPRIPACDRSIFADENEKARRRDAVFPNRERCNLRL